MLKNNPLVIHIKEKEPTIMTIRANYAVVVSSMQNAHPYFERSRPLNYRSFIVSRKAGKLGFYSLVLRS